MRYDQVSILEEILFIFLKENVFLFFKNIKTQTSGFFWCNGANSSNGFFF